MWTEASLREGSKQGRMERRQERQGFRVSQRRDTHHNWFSVPNGAHSQSFGGELKWGHPIPSLGVVSFLVPCVYTALC